MVKFWVTFALIVAALGVLSECDAVALHNPLNFSLSVPAGRGERGSGVAQTETRKVGPFTRIEGDGAVHFDVSVKPGNAGDSVEITADDNLLHLYTTEVVDGVLKVSHAGSLSPKSRLVVKVAVPALDAVTLEGANHLDLAIDSTQPLSVHLSGAGRVRASGKVGPLTLHSEGAGNIDAYDLIAPEVDVHIEGAGKAKVHATESLKAHVEGAGTITYRGNPKNVEKDIEGVGRVAKAN